jgi:DNA-binding MarR family transcriptional regulator
LNIVKPPDDKTAPPLLDHIGIDLFHAAQRWKTAFEQRMIASGYEIFGQAASNALAYIGPLGIAQSALAQRMGITKQATQQFVETLQSHSIVTRTADPDDSRAKRVLLTPQGQTMMTAANAVKRAIEADYRDTLDDAAFSALKTALARLNTLNPPRQAR